MRKYFGKLAAVDGVNLRIERGLFYGLVGPNGAGKSTTLGLLTGVLRPSAGRIRLLGRDFDPDRPWFKQRLGVVDEQPALFGRLRVAEQLELVARLQGLEKGSARERSRQLLALLRLEDAADRLVVDLSRGMAKKLALACALVHAPLLYFLDEPFEGLDAWSSELVSGLLAALCARGATVVLTTHILDTAERLCGKVGIINRGRLVAEHPLSERQGGAGLRELYFRAVGESRPQLELPNWLEFAGES